MKLVHNYRRSDLARIAGLALAYALLAKIVLGLFSANGVISLVWPPSGLALAALLISGKKYWPGIFIGALAGNLMAGSPAEVSFFIAMGNTLEGLTCIWLLEHFNHFDPRLTHSRDYLKLGIAGSVGACVGALIGVSTLVLTLSLTKQTELGSLSQWWQGDALGIFLGTPLILVWRQPPQGWFKHTRAVETIACFGLAFLVGQYIFMDWFQGFFGYSLKGYWIFLFITWAAIRFGRHGALLMISIVSVQALLSTILKVGVFSNDLGQGGLFNFWLYTLALTVVGITLAIAVDERKAAEARVQRQIKLYKALSEINQSIVRMEQQTELFPLVCRCAVEFGGMKMAWVGQLEKVSGMIVPVVDYGDLTGYLSSIHISSHADVPEGQGPTGVAMRENRSVIINDYLSNPTTAPWHETAADFGWVSAASFPIQRGGEPFAVLAVYHTEINAFDEEAIALLEEMSTDISFALDNFDRESQRQLAQEKLQQTQVALVESHDRYMDLYEFAPIGYLTLSSQGLITQLNWRASAMLGMDRKSIIHKRITQFIDESEKVRWSRMFLSMKELATEEELSFDLKFTLHNGMTFVANLNCARMSDDDEQSMLRITLEDVTMVKKTEADLRVAATAFESHDGLMITDAENRILKINQAFAHISGYSNDEVVGKNPRIFGSGRHDAAFFAAMLDCVNKTGRWSGEIWNRRKNGELYPLTLTVTSVKADNGVIINYVGTVTDITQIKAAEEEIQRLAFFDPLTNLPNRRLLMDRFNHALTSCSRSGRHGAVLFIDLDHFKTLNDSLGHDIGDLLLQQVATRLTACVREGDTVARFGGDEYVVVLEDLGEQSFEAATQTETIVEKILRALSQPYQLGVHIYHITSSIGIAVFSNYDLSVDELLKQADIAMYQAKKAGRNTLRFFNPQMQISITARVALERELRIAIDSQQLHLFYQIQVDNLGHPLGAEALIRWIHPERGLVSPAQFIPLAEETGLILPIGHWVLDTACAQIKAWHKNAQTRDLTLSINVSARQFRQPDFVAQVRAAIERHSIDPMQLKIELTESLLLENIEDTIVSMIALGEIGVQFSLDDFGTGYSSLQYLKRLPLFQLKIDQSFVRDIVTDSHDRSIVRTITAMAQSLYLNVIAEGVETEQQRELLLSNGCKRYQGYLFGKPLPIDQFNAALKQSVINTTSPLLEHV